MTWLLNRILCFCALIFSAGLVACQSGSAPSSPQESIGAMAGPVIDERLELTLQVRDQSGADEYYEVHRDGTLHFGGGMNARLEKPTWSTILTGEQQREIVSAIAQHGWIESELRSTHQPPDQSYRITVRNVHGSARCSIKGANAGVEPVRDILRRISLQRLEPDLQKLPEPGLQPR